MASISKTLPITLPHSKYSMHAILRHTCIFIQIQPALLCNYCLNTHLHASYTVHCSCNAFQKPLTFYVYPHFLAGSHMCSCYLLQFFSLKCFFLLLEKLNDLDKVFLHLIDKTNSSLASHIAMESDCTRQKEASSKGELTTTAN